MKIPSMLALGAAALLVGGLPVRAAGPLNVITTTEDLASIAREVAGDKATVESLSRGYQDPHFVEAKPSFVLKLNKADLLIAVGRELEIGWLPPLITQARNAKIQPGGEDTLTSRQSRILEIPTANHARLATSIHGTRVLAIWRTATRGQGHQQKWLSSTPQRRLLRPALADSRRV